MNSTYTKTLRPDSAVANELVLFSILVIEFHYPKNSCPLSELDNIKTWPCKVSRDCQMSRDCLFSNIICTYFHFGYYAFRSEYNHLCSCELS